MEKKDNEKRSYFFSKIMNRRMKNENVTNYETVSVMYVGSCDAADIAGNNKGAGRSKGQPAEEGEGLYE